MDQRHQRLAANMTNDEQMCEAVVEALSLRKCYWHDCDGRYQKTGSSLAEYAAALGCSAPGDESTIAWKCDVCGSVMFEDANGTLMNGLHD
jgi:hypothetical protein